MPWIPFITNHLYYSSQTCNGDPNLLREKWSSSAHNIVNVHSWNGELMTHCDHDETVSDDTAWLTLDSEAHRALKSVVLDKRLLKDIGKLSDFCHTGDLETYHSVLLKYAPKRQHFSYGGMQTRLQLAALDHNHGVDRKQVTDSTGNPLVRQVFSKGRKTWHLRNVYQKKEYTYLDEILSKIVERREDESIFMNDPSSHITLPDLQPNLALTERPDLQVALENRYKRMGNKEF